MCALACSSATLAPPPITPPPLRAAEPDQLPIDPIAALTPEDGGEMSWVVSGPIWLELGGAAITANPSTRPIAVSTIDHQGNLVRVAVALEHARFSVWADRKQLLAVVAHDQRIDPVRTTSGPRRPHRGTTSSPLVEAQPARDAGNARAADDLRDAEVVLRAGATVRRLAHRDRWTRVRYLGALEIEGWVPDDALADRGHPHHNPGRIPAAQLMLMVVPGAVIRSEPRWSGRELATVASGYFLDLLREVDDAWVEVAYRDGDVVVHGFVSKRDPPGRLHHGREIAGALPITPNATVASGTCLFASAGGEAIGYVVDARAVELEEASAGWWTLGLDTPWGPLGFAARGPSRGDLATCAPPGALPTPAPALPPAP